MLCFVAGFLSLIFLVFCVVIFGGVPVVDLFIFLCCVFLAGFVSLIFSVFCVVFFGGVRVVDLFSFLCCVLWRGSCRSSF